MRVPFFDLKKQYEDIKIDLDKAVLSVLSSGNYIGGGCVQNFEKEVSAYLGIKHAISCSSGTAALVLALRACGVKEGDEVITTPFSFFATAESISCIGAIPVFVDIKPEDYNIDPARIEQAITEKTTAILPVHIFGAPSDMDAINVIAKKYNLKVIEDAAQAFGSEYKGEKAGTLGDVGCFSFYPTKNLGGCGDGGMVVTDDDNLAIILRALKEHGSGTNGAKAREILGGEAELLALNETETETNLYNSYKYYNYLIGYNSRLDAIQAAVLSVKLRHLDYFNKKRTVIANKYLEGLEDIIRKPCYKREVKTCWHQFVICSDFKYKLCSYLCSKGIGNATFYPIPLHKQKAFSQKYFKNHEVNLPIAEKISSESVCIPIFPEMTDEQIQNVINTVNTFFNINT